MALQRSSYGKDKGLMATLILFVGLALAVPLPAFMGGCACVGQIWKLVSASGQSKPSAAASNTNPAYKRKHGRLTPMHPDSSGSEGFVFATSNPLTNRDFKKVTLPYGTIVKVLIQHEFVDPFGREGYPMDEILIMSGSHKGKHVFLGDQEVMGMSIYYKRSIGAY
jgi:hypothetical protein